MNPRIAKTAKVATSVGLAIGLTFGGTGLAGADSDDRYESSSRDDDRVTDPAVIAAASAAALAAVPGGTVLEVETDDDRGVAYEVKVRDANGRKVEVKLDSSYNVVRVENDDDDDHDDDRDDDRDDDQVVSAAERAAASKAALAAVPGATVRKVEAEDGPVVAYEVKLRQADGERAEVYLDADFNVVRIKYEGMSYRKAAKVAAKDAVPTGKVRKVKTYKDGRKAKYNVVMRDKGKRVRVLLDGSYDVVRIKRSK